MQRKLLRLVFFIALSLTVGIIGSIYTADSISSWYAYLNKPSFSPPNFVFGPVWTTLYTLMGISAYMVWTKSKNKKESKNVKTALNIFYVQLFFNFIWSFLFFGLQNPLLALVDIILLWALVLTMIMRFYGINKYAGLLQIPYLLWISFATILNASILFLN